MKKKTEVFDVGQKVRTKKISVKKDLKNKEGVVVDITKHCVWHDKIGYLVRLNGYDYDVFFEWESLIEIPTSLLEIIKWKMDNKYYSRGGDMYGDMQKLYDALVEANAENELTWGDE